MKIMTGNSIGSDCSYRQAFQTKHHTEVPCLMRIFGLRKSVLCKICVSWTVEGPLLTQKFPTCAGICGSQNRVRFCNRLFGHSWGPLSDYVIQMLVESYAHTFYYRPFFNSPDCFCYRLFGLPANLYRTSAQYSRVSYSGENGLVITSYISWAYSLAICRLFIRFLHNILREKVLNYLTVMIG